MDNLLTLIRFLAEPFGHNCEDGQLVIAKTADSTESLWLELCKKVWDKVTVSSTCQDQIKHTESSSSWKLTCTILDVLQQLKIKVEEVEKNQSEEEKSIEVLSVQSQFYIQKCIEIVVGFGILPYYLPRVGMPDKFRKFSVAQKYWEADKMVRPVVQFHRLVHCLDVLIDLCQHGSFVGLIVPHHIIDIMCGLVQICQSPVKVPKIYNEKTEMDHSAEAKQCDSLSPEEYADVMCAKEKMDSLMHLTFYPIVPRRLWIHALLLLGAGQKPHWFIAECAQLQYDQLLKEKDGLLTITQAVLENLGSAQEWRADKIISNLVIAACENRNKINYNKIVINLGTQSLSMIMKSQMREGNEPIDSLTSKLRDIGLLCAVVLTNINKEVIHQIVWDSLFEPVLRLNKVCEKNTEAYSTFKEIEDCAKIANSLLNIINHYNQGGISFEVRDFQSSLWSTFFQIIEACDKYEIMEDDQKASIQNLKSNIITPIVALKNMANQNSKDVPTMKISKFLVDLIVRQTDVLKDIVIEEMNENVDTKKIFTESKALSFKLLSRFNGCRENGFQLLSNSCEMLVKQLLSTDNQSTEEEKLAAVIFTELMSYNVGQLTNKQHTGGKKGDVKATRKNPNYGLAEEDSSGDYETFVVYTLIHAIGGNADVLETFIDKQQSKDPEKFLDLIMNRLSTELTSGSGGGGDFNESIVQALGILESFCEAACRVDKDPVGGSTSYSKTDNKVHVWKQLETFIPYLKTFMVKSGLSSSVHQTAANILKCIESRGRISSFCGTSKSSEDEIKLSRYEKAMQEVESPLIYIKGHGLLELRKMLEENDKEALENKEDLLRIFQAELNNDDSYAYLMSIEGMAALGIQFHPVVIPTLIHLYDFPFKDVPLDMDGDEKEKVSRKIEKGLKGETLKMTDEDLVEYRLKVGEILVKLMQRLGGEIAPLYRVPMANVCFRLIRDEDPAIKASALANLGELCHVLKFALANILTEVWETVEIMLETEKEIQVRRAGYHLMVLLLRGIAKELEVEFIVHNKDVGIYLRDARRLLTKMKKTESDEVSKCHIDLALAEIALIATKFFMIASQATK